MAMGSYFLGSIVKIPVNITIDGIPISTIIPVLEKIILPSGVSESGLPRPMTQTHPSSSIFYYSYEPKIIGDYIAIISTTYGGKTYNTIENFTVNNNVIKIATKNIPRAVAS